jgi:hypothetical protein
VRRLKDLVLEQDKSSFYFTQWKVFRNQDATHFLATAGEVHLSSIQYLLENSIQASLSLSIRYYFLKAKDDPIKISIPVLILS